MGSDDNWPRRDDNGECCPNQYQPSECHPATPSLLISVWSIERSGEPSQSRSRAWRGAKCHVTRRVRYCQISPALSWLTRVMCTRVLCPLSLSLYPPQHTQAFYNPPAPDSALFIYVTREATWPELPASGDRERKLEISFQRQEQGGGAHDKHVTKHLNMCPPRVTRHMMVNNHTQ